MQKIHATGSKGLSQKQIVSTYIPGSKGLSQKQIVSTNIPGSKGLNRNKLFLRYSRLKSHFQNNVFPNCRN